MARTALCETGEWHLADEDQDIRGWPLYDISGDRLGTITELIIDTRLKRIDAIVLDNGKEYPASDIELGDEAAHLQADTGASDAGTGTAGRSRTAPGGAGLSAQQPGTTTGFVDYEGTFRQHYKSTYGSSTGDYDDRYEPAYRHGYTYGSNPEYRHREFSTAEPELRRHYEAEQARARSSRYAMP